MNVKKLVVILIAFAFSLTMVLSCVGLLAIKKIQIDFNVLSYSSNEGEYSNQTSEQVQETLDKYLGANLLTIDIEKIQGELSAHPKLEAVEIVKIFPNVLSVKVKERREIYSFNYNDKDFVLDENGFVLTDDGKTTQGTSLIKLTLDNIDIDKIEVGKKIQIKGDQGGDIILQTFNIAKAVGLADCIEKIRVKDYTNGFDIFFMTRTGVEIQVTDLMIDGETKVQTAFEVYDKVATDYQKRFGIIKAHYTEVDGAKAFVVDHKDDIYGTKELFNQPINN